MGLLHTGSDKLLEIRTAHIDFVIKSKGKMACPYPDKDTGSSTVKIAGIDIEQINIPEKNILEKYSVQEGVSFHEITLSPLFFEQTDYVMTIRSREGKTLKFRCNSALVEGQVNPAIEGDSSLILGVINFGNNVGFSDFSVWSEGRRLLSIRIEIYPTKISYKDDYQEMMADINNMISESILDFMKRTYQVFVPDHRKNDVSAVFFTVIQAIYDKYLQAINRAVNIPHHKLISEYEVLPHYKASRTDARSEKWLWKHPEYVIKSDTGFRVKKVLSVRKRTTYDTLENRLVKHMLVSTIRGIDDFSQRYRKSRQQVDENILKKVGEMAGGIRRLLTTTFLANVSEYNTTRSMSLVFGMAPGYRELYKHYLMLLNGISVGGDLFHMSVRETAQLYEYWCFIKLYDILRSRYTLKSPDIIRVDRKGVTVDLVRGRASRVTFLNTKTGERIFLMYNPSETVTQTVNQRPDNVLELEKRGSSSVYKYVFDAKYRIETNPDGQYYPDTKPGPKVDDINTMHRYRDSIVYENPESRFTFEKTMFGAYILFPYSNEEEYKNHRFYKSIESVNIGGLPFLPSATTLVTELLDELVSDSLESAFERAILPVGIEERLKTVDWDKREVLIGFVPDEKQLDIFLKKGMYFTNCFDVDNLPIRYVALYEKGKGINWYGEVISYYEANQCDLPGKSGQEKERYHVFKIYKDWKLLKTPISVSEFGPSPIAYTNFFLLSESTSYSELMLRTEADYRYFTELKRRTDQVIIEGADEETIFEVENIRTLIRKDGIYVVQDGKILKVCTLQEFSKHPNTTFRRLHKFAES